MIHQLKTGANFTDYKTGVADKLPRRLFSRRPNTFAWQNRRVHGLNLRPKATKAQSRKLRLKYLNGSHRKRHAPHTAPGQRVAVALHKLICMYPTINGVSQARPDQAALGLPFGTPTPTEVYVRSITAGLLNEIIYYLCNSALPTAENPLPPPYLPIPLMPVTMTKAAWNILREDLLHHRTYANQRRQHLIKGNQGQFKVAPFNHVDKNFEHPTPTPTLICDFLNHSWDSVKQALSWAERSARQRLASARYIGQLWGILHNLCCIPSETGHFPGETSVSLISPWLKPWRDPSDKIENRLDTNI